METTDLMPLIEQLDDNVDDLKEALDPLLKDALSKTAGNLPLLDKAHLYILVTYAIESILFSYLRLNGINAKEHPVFRELIRVKQYFEKIKIAESAGIVRGPKLDRAAAGRFIKHALAGNEKYDANFVQKQVVKKAATHTRFDEPSQKLKANDGKHLESENAASDNKNRSDTANPIIGKPPSENATGDMPLEGATTIAKAKQAKGKRRRKSQSDGPEAVSNTNAPEDEEKQVQKKRKKVRKKQRVLENY